MAQKTKSVTLTIITIVSIILLTAISTSIIYKRQIQYLHNQNKYILEWVANRHGKDWAERIKEWAHHKAIKQNTDLNNNEKEMPLK